METTELLENYDIDECWFCNKPIVKYECDRCLNCNELIMDCDCEHAND